MYVHWLIFLLFVTSDSLFRYQFNKERMAISLPLPLGGKNVNDLNIPTTLSIPSIDLNRLGISIPPKTYSLPPFTIPTTLDFSIPLLGLAEASTKINTNYYLWEGSFLGGNNTVDVPNYIVQYKALAQSPLKLLSYKLEGKSFYSSLLHYHRLLWWKSSVLPIIWMYVYISGLHVTALRYF